MYCSTEVHPRLTSSDRIEESIGHLQLRTLARLLYSKERQFRRLTPPAQRSESKTLTAIVADSGC